MATAAEIEGYKPQPELAFGGGLLPLGATDAVLDFSPAIAAWHGYAQDKYNRDLQILKQTNEMRLKNAAQLQKAFADGTFKGWNIDTPEYMKMWGKFTDAVKADPTSYTNPANPNYFKTQQLLDDAMTYAQNSAQQRTDFDTVFKDWQLHPKSYPANFGDTLNKYREGGVEYRMQNPINVTPQISVNATGYLSKVAQIQPDSYKLTTDGTRDKSGKLIYTNTPEYGEKSQAALQSEAQGEYTSNKQGWDEAFDQLPMTDQAKYGDPQGWITEMGKERMTMASKQRVVSPFVSPYESAYERTSGTQAAQTGGVEYPALNAQQLSDPESNIYQDVPVRFANGVEGFGQQTHVFGDMTVPQMQEMTDIMGNTKKTTVNVPVSAIWNVNGKLYVQPANLEADANGNYAVQDFIPITDIKNQILIPYLHEKESKGTMTEKEIQRQLDIYDGKQPAETSTKSSTTTVKKTVNKTPTFTYTATATGANGAKLYLKDGQWVDVNGNPVK